MALQPTKVNLIPVLKAGKFDKWQMSDGGPPTDPATFPHIKIPEKSTGEIIFTIKGAPDNGITFAPTVKAPPPGSGPIYVGTGTTKPSSGLDPQFGYTVDASGKVLTLTDANSAKGGHAYTLQFVNAGPIDPIIDNGGPGKAPMSWEFIALGVVGLVAIAFLLLRPVLKSKS